MVQKLPKLKLNTVTIRKWLDEKAFPKKGIYQLRSFREKRKARQDALDELRRYADVAHADARRNFLKVISPDLSPFKPAVSVLVSYPSFLHKTTLKGYLGETIAGLVAQTFGSHGLSKWEIPAYLFRFHNAAMHQIDSLVIGSSSSPAKFPKLKPIPGRFGNDALAFIRDQEGRITHVLLCEAKCSATHNVKLISDAHETLAKRQVLSGLHELATIMSDYPNDPDARRWQRSLLELYKAGPKKGRLLHSIVYVHGQAPKLRPTWMDRNTVHSSYGSCKTPLSAEEVCVSRISQLLKAIYG